MKYWFRGLSAKQKMSSNAELEDVGHDSRLGRRGIIGMEDKSSRINDILALIKESHFNLSARDKNIVTLYVSGYTQREIASQYKLTQPGIRHILKQIGKKLNQYMEE